VRRRRPTRRPQPRDIRGRYTRSPQIPPWGWLVCIAAAVLIMVATKL
jgi:hypothetical protein